MSTGLRIDDEMSFFDAVRLGWGMRGKTPEALDLTPALSSLVFVVRPPTATPTGRYLGCVHLQRLLREPPAALVSGMIDKDLPSLAPDTSLAGVTRYFAAYNLVCGPVVDEENHLLGAVTVDDVLDHLLPHDWRERADEPELDSAS